VYPLAGFGRIDLGLALCHFQRIGVQWPGGRTPADFTPEIKTALVAGADEVVGFVIPE
jgi:uncharacterized NAD-dependent epimerase/dehydratase family protein